jgi:hypothetical protein
VTEIAREGGEDFAGGHMAAKMAAKKITTFNKK